MMLTQNSKIKKMSGPKTFNFGIPAYRSANGFNTCPKAGACATGCYATMGAYRFSNVAQAFERRLAQTLAAEFAREMILEIRKRKAGRIRIHDSGDFYSLGYVSKWFTVMHALPGVQFYAYTKQVKMFKALQAAGRIPPNFILIFSYGGTEDKNINPCVDRHARVFSSLADLNAAGYVDTSEDDAMATGPNKKIGLVYHGTKSLKNTNWEKVKI